MIGTAAPAKIAARPNILYKAATAEIDIADRNAIIPNVISYVLYIRNHLNFLTFFV